MGGVSLSTFWFFLIRKGRLECGGKDKPTWQKVTEHKIHFITWNVSVPQMCTQMWSSTEITSLQALPGNCSQFLAEKWFSAKHCTEAQSMIKTLPTAPHRKELERRNDQQCLPSQEARPGSPERLKAHWNKDLLWPYLFVCLSVFPAFPLSLPLFYLPFLPPVFFPLPSFMSSFCFLFFFFFLLMEKYNFVSRKHCAHLFVVEHVDMERTHSFKLWTL